MKQLFLTCGMFAALVLACGCSKPKPQEASWFRGGSTKEKVHAAKNSAEQLKRDLQVKLQKLTDKLRTMDEVLVSAKASEKKIVKQLRDRGVRSMEDLDKPKFKDDDDVQRNRTKLLNNLKEQAKYGQMKKEYLEAKNDGEDTLDRLERATKLAQAGISDKEMEEFAITVAKIDERLKTADAGKESDFLKSNPALDKALKVGGD